MTHWIAACLLLGLRTAPVLGFAPPFSLVRMPALFRLLFGLGLSATLVAANPAATALADDSIATFFAAGVREFGLGVVIVLAFQLVFGALELAGRAIDIQAGYGLALLVDPASQAQMPLVGTLFAYAAAAVFFGMNGHIELLRFFSASLDLVPLGSWAMPHSIARLVAFMGTVFLGACGVAGGAMLALFLVDMSIAAMSRTIPQMNVLILGFQAKTIVLLLVLPTSFGVGGVLLMRLMATTLRSLPGLL